MSVEGVVEDGVDTDGWDAAVTGDNTDDLNESEVLGTGEEENGGGENGGSENGGLGVVIKTEEDSKEDLFEAALTEGSKDTAAEGADGLGGDVKPTATRGIYGPINNQLYQGRRYFCYVGNMTWWTTDEDLAGAINGTGIQDLLDIKFYENRANGQSKGFALSVFASDASVRAVMEKLPKLSLHGQQLIVLPYTKQAQQQLEAATRKPGEKAPAASSTAQAAQKAGQNFMGTVRLGQQPGLPPPQPQGPPLILRPAQPGPPLMGHPPRPGLPVLGGHPPPMLHQQPMRLPPQTRFQGGLPGHPQPLPHQQPQLRPPPPQGHMQHHLGGPPGHPQPSGPVPLIPPPTTNRPPPGMPPQQGGPGAPSPLMAGLRQPPPGAYINPHVYRPPNHGPPQQDHAVSEPEFEEIMNRNRTVSSSAISRAVSDAAAGDYASAIETLVTAISLIRQSRVAGDERCKVLITSLQDTLHGIETKSYGGGGKRSRNRSRSPRDRGSSKRHRRSSRSRSRSRERYDDYRTSSSSSRRY